MDARPDPAHAARPLPGARHAHAADLRPILDQLGPALDHPVGSLRRRFDRLLVASPTAGPHDPLRCMAALCDGLRELTQSYLDYADSLQPSRSSRPAPIRLGDLLDELDRRARAATAARGLAWRCTIERRDALVTTEAPLCRQLLERVLANALAYTPAGGRVWLRAGVGADHWSAAIGDSGPGIPAEARERVFEPYARLPREERSGIPGSGLGLTIARVLAERLGGTVEIDPSTAAGTTILARFPHEPSGAGR